jgi:hypothetical protein
VSIAKICVGRSGCSVGVRCPRGSKTPPPGGTPNSFNTTPHPVSPGVYLFGLGTMVASTLRQAASQACHDPLEPSEPSHSPIRGWSSVFLGWFLHVSHRTTRTLEPHTTVSLDTSEGLLSIVAKRRIGKKGRELRSSLIHPNIPNPKLN